MGKKILTLVSCTLFASGTYAVGPGFYLGAMGGYATNNGSEQQAVVTNSVTGQNQTITIKPKSNQAGLRGYLGYRFNWWAGLELGATYYSVVNYDKGNVPTSTTTKTGIATVDLVVVGYFPIAELFDIFGKAGVAAVYQGTSRSIRPAPNKSKYEVRAAPTFAVGFGYNLTQNWLVDLSWTRVQTGGILKSVDLYALGISYHFVNRYCGQFLCDD